jgi:multidrug resistance protein
MDEEYSNIEKDDDQNEKNVEQVNLLSSIPDEISIYNVFNEFEHRLILFWISFTVILLPLSDTIYLPAIHTITIDLKTTDELVSLTISMYLLFIGISSLIWGVISDRWGRNLTMRIGLLLFLFSSILCIFASNIFILLFLRIIQGSSVSVTIVVGQGIIADIYPSNQRGWATGVFFIPVLLGVVLGPISGGILTFYFSWRSTFVFQSIFSLIILIIYALFMPETHQYQVLTKLTDKKIIERNEILKPKLSNPLLPLKYLSHISIIPYILSASTAFASIIISQCLLAIILAQQPYYYNELKIGLSFIPLSIGEVLGCVLGGYLADKGDEIFQKKRLENRLIPGTIAFSLIPIGLIIYGWAFQFELNIVIPILSASIVAFGQAVYRPAVYSYLTLKEQQNSATVSSANNSLNFVFASIGLSMSVPIINLINIGPFFTILSIINILAIILTIGFILKKFIAFGKNYQSV